MRHGSSNNRGRQRNNRGGSPRKNNNGNQKTQVFDSNGPDVRIRGTAHQVAEKYVALAKDAQSIGDVVMHQNYLQHAEHYQRLISTWEADNNKKNFEISDNEFGEGDGNQSTSQDASPKKAVSSKKDAPSKDDDLGLPASLLGNEKETELENS